MNNKNLNIKQKQENIKFKGELEINLSDKFVKIENKNQKNIFTY